MKIRYISIIFFALVGLAFVPSANAKFISDNFKLICAEPCPVDAAYKRNFKRGAIIAYRWLKEWTKTGFPAKSLPVKIHLVQDEICNSEAPNSAYAIVSGPKAGRICMQSFLDFKYQSHYGNLSHELAHFYFPTATDNDTFRDIEHGIIYSIEDMIVTPVLRPVGFCNGNYTERESMQQVVYQLCMKAGFDYDKVPAFLQELQRWRKAHPDTRITRTDYAEVMRKVLGAKKGDIAADIILNFKVDFRTD